MGGEPSGAGAEAAGGFAGGVVKSLVRQHLTKLLGSFPKMREIESWINDAVETQDLRIERIADDEATVVRESVTKTFVDGSWRTWSLGLRKPYVCHSSVEYTISQILPVSADVDVYFIPETDDGEEVPVYRVRAGAVELLIQDCPFFEYYVVSAGYDWLVAETEHDVLITCSASESTLRIKPGGYTVDLNQR